MNFEEFTFIRPWVLTLIPVALIILFGLYKSNQHKSQLSNLIDPLLMNFIQDRKSFKFSKLIYWFAGLFILLAIAAAAGPSLQKTKIETYNAGTPLIIILDTSISMNSTDLKPTRIQRAKFKILDIIKHKKDSLVGLIAYSGSAHTIVPLSYDFDILENLLLDLSPETMPYFGNDLDAALKKAINLLENVGYEKADILLIVDEIYPDFSKQSEEIIKSNTKINTMIYAVGKKNTQSPILYQNKLLKRNSDQKLILINFNFNSIQKFADDTGAKLILFNSSSSDVESIVSNLTDVQNSHSSQNKDVIEIKLDSGYWLLIVILILLLPLFRRGNYWLILGLIFSSHFMTQTQSLKAQSILEYFMDDDSAGKYHYDKQEYQKATDKFEDKSWKGLSYIKNKNYQNAINELEKSEKIYDWYNQANAYAYIQDFESALNLYEKIISKSEELILNDSIASKEKNELREVLDRARFNKNYIEKLIAKNQREQQNNDQQEQQQNQDNSQADQTQNQQQSQSQQKSEQNQSEQGQSEQQQQKNEQNVDNKSNSQAEQEQNNQQNETNSSQSKNAEKKENEESQKQRFSEQSKDLDKREENKQEDSEQQVQQLKEQEQQNEQAQQENQKQKNENSKIQINPKELTEKQKKQKSLQKIKAKLKDMEFSTQSYLKRKLEYELNEQNKKGEVRKNKGIQL